MPLTIPIPGHLGAVRQILADAGIEVTRGVLAEEARQVHLGHFLRVTRERPMITLETRLNGGFLRRRAAGRAASHDHRKTGERALSMSMRAMHDAVMTGIGTILADDPLLNIRLPGFEHRRLLRVVLDSDLCLPPSTQACRVGG